MGKRRIAECVDCHDEKEIHAFEMCRSCYVYFKTNGIHWTPEVSSRAGRQEPIIRQDMNEAEVSWLAALIDGEGSVMLTRRAPSTKAREGNHAFRTRTHYRAQIVVYNTDLRLMEALAWRTGVQRIYEHARPEVKNHVKIAYSWRMASPDCRVLIPRLLPWLVCKKEQAELLLEAVTLKHQIRCEKGRGVTHTERDAVGARMAELYDLIRELNTKGRREVE